MICLDAWAVIAWLDDDPRVATVVRGALRDDAAVMSWVNVGEVSYIVERRRGRARAEAVVASIRASCVLDPATPERILAAASIKAAAPMSFADAFAVATARAFEAPLATGDREIIAALTRSEVIDLT